MHLLQRQRLPALWTAHSVSKWGMGVMQGLAFNNSAKRKERPKAKK